MFVRLGFKSAHEIAGQIGSIGFALGWLVKRYVRVFGEGSGEPFFAE